MKITRKFGDSTIEIKLTRQEMNLAHHIVELEAFRATVRLTYDVFTDDELDEIAEEMNDTIIYMNVSPDDAMELALSRLGYDERIRDAGFL